MGKDSTEKKAKKDKKEKKEKRAEAAGVVKPKKEKKDKKSKVNGELLEAELKKAPEDSLVNVVEDVVMGGGDGDGETAVASIASLVPFAHPLVEEHKDVKKILRAVKKCMSLPCPIAPPFLQLISPLLTCTRLTFPSFPQPPKLRPSAAA